jgi:hypothetical protein
MLNTFVCIAGIRFFGVGLIRNFVLSIPKFPTGRVAMRFLVKVEVDGCENIPLDIDDVRDLLYGISDSQIEGSVDIVRVEDNDRGDLE